MNIYEIQKQYKDNVTSNGVSYGDMPIEEFAYRLWETEKEKAPSLEATMPMGIFADKSGLNNEDFGKMLGYSKTIGYEPTERSYADDVIPELGAIREGLNGWTYGFGDEVVGSLAAVTDSITGKAGNKSFDALYTQYRDAERAKIKQFRAAHPVSSAATGVAGTLLNPLTWLGGGGTALSTTAGKYGSAAAKGFGWGTLFGIGESEKETASEVLSEAKDVGITSGILSMGMQRFFPGANPTLLKEFNKYSKDVNVNKLKVLKNTLYDKAKKSGIHFDSKDLAGMLLELKRIRAGANQSVLKSKEIDKVVNLATTLKGQKQRVQINHMDDLVEQVNALYYGTNRQFPALQKMAQAIDDTIQGKAASLNGGNNPLTIARMANSKYKKVQALDDELYKVKGLMKGEGGDKEKGGVITSYKRAANNILQNPKKAQWFSPEEIAMFEKFVEGTVSQRMTQRFSDLSMNTRGFLTAMAFAGSYMQPLFIVPTMAGLAVKTIADKKIKKDAMGLVDNLSGLVRVKPLQKRAEAIGVSGAVGSEIEQ